MSKSNRPPKGHKTIIKPKDKRGLKIWTKDVFKDLHLQWCPIDLKSGILKLDMDWNPNKNIYNNKAPTPKDMKSPKASKMTCFLHEVSQPWPFNSCNKKLILMKSNSIIWIRFMSDNWNHLTSMQNCCILSVKTYFLKWQKIV